jgi:hypothetical protein
MERIADHREWASLVDEAARLVVEREALLYAQSGLVACGEKLYPTAHETSYDVRPLVRHPTQPPGRIAIQRMYLKLLIFLTII